MDAFKISCIVAFSKFRFYGLMGSSGTIDSTIFGTFLHKLLKSIHTNHSIDSNNLIFVMDNASIHKSSHVAGMLKNKAVRILTIAPYEPWLNPTEKLILALKSKLRMLHNRGKLITLSIVKSVADEVAQVKLESMINSSIKETLDKMKIDYLGNNIVFYSKILIHIIFIRFMKFVFCLFLLMFDSKHFEFSRILFRLLSFLSKFWFLLQ